MTLNPFAWWRQRQAREQEQKVKDARAGKASSGYLGAGERQGLFRAAVQQPNRMRRRSRRNT